MGMGESCADGGPQTVALELRRDRVELGHGVRARTHRRLCKQEVAGSIPAGST